VISERREYKLLPDLNSVRISWEFLVLANKD
jgi:hypothetical protein